MLYYTKQITTIKDEHYKGYTELRTIKDELMSDLNPDEQEEILDLAWSQPYSFLFIDNFAPAGQRYYRKFDLIEI
jgi:hypothetical protein